MPEFFLTAMGRRYFERDVPEIARQLARIADALERLAPAGNQPGTTTTTTAPAGDAEPRGADADEPRDPGA